jgi:hypothetical protein
MLKEVLTSALLFRYYDHTLPYILETDISDGVIASILSQKYRDDYFPIVYFSKTIQAAELNYEVYNKEILAIIKLFANWHTELTSTPH